METLSLILQLQKSIAKNGVKTLTDQDLLGMLLIIYSKEQKELKDNVDSQEIEGDLGSDQGF